MTSQTYKWWQFFCTECGRVYGNFVPAGQRTDPPDCCASVMTMSEPKSLLPREASALPMPRVMRDIEPYRTAAFDVATGGTVEIGSRSEHRAFLRRNGYVEVGNEPLRQTRPQATAGPVAPDLAQAYDIVAARNNQ